MSRLVDARLVNDPFGDPGLFVDFRNRRRAFLFDLGDIGALSVRELSRVTHGFVSHAHLDHFNGFDRLLRLRLSGALPFHLVGPVDFTDRVEAKLRAYTWNLLDETVPDFHVTVSEFIGDRIARCSRFAARERFARRDVGVEAATPGLVLSEPDVVVRATLLDHATPCLAFALQERPRVTVAPAELDRLNLSAGPWINVAKRALRAGAGDDTSLAVGNGRTFRLGDLRAGVFTMTAGQKIAYVVDAADHADNRARVIALARNADQLFIETAFADEDAAQARARHHMTAGAAGHVGRAAGVKAVIPLHFSARYSGRPDHLVGQCEAAFRGDEPLGGEP